MNLADDPAPNSNNRAPSPDPFRCFFLPALLIDGMVPIGRIHRNLILSKGSGVKGLAPHSRTHRN
jgi:hypothetical protein